MDRTELMTLHLAARQRREAAPLGSDAYREAAEEIARIEVAIAAAEEPSPEAQVGSGGGTPPDQGRPPDQNAAIDRGAIRGP